MKFGTDGIRSTDVDLLVEVGYRLGLAARGKSKIVVGEDNRPTSARIAKAVMAGLVDAGVDVVYGGVMPTPALQYAVRRFTADGGVAVTASHNPARYNGLKVVDAEGEKPHGEALLPIEEALDAAHSYVERDCPSADESVLKAYPDKFRRFGALPVKVAIDCANGATYPIVKRVMALHEVDATYLHHGDGKQINKDCGALHPEALAELRGYDLSVAFDGDGDRCILVTRSGRVVDGDGILYLLAAYRRRKGMDVGGAVVSTVLANGALSHALGGLSLRLVRTDVGDAEVADAMRRRNICLGGEPSGHILADGYVADGIYTAMLLMQIATEYDLDEMLEPYKPLPQVHRKVKASPEALHRASKAAEKWQDYLAGTGRVIVRPSGTEPVVRITVECADSHLALTVADAIAQVALS